MTSFECISANYNKFYRTGLIDLVKNYVMHNVKFSAFDYTIEWMSIKFVFKGTPSPIKTSGTDFNLYRVEQCGSNKNC